MNGSDFLVDYETPFERVVSYDLEILSGPDAGTSTPTQTVVLSPASGCIQDPLTPGTAIPMYGDVGPNGEPALKGQALQSFEYATDMTLLQVLGNPDPVALIGQRMSANNVSMAVVTEAAQQTTLLRNLIMQSGVLLVRPLKSWGGQLPGCCYVGAKTVTELPVDVSWGGSVTNWGLNTTLIAAPTMNVLVPIWTYGAVQALFTTYDQNQTALAGKTYLDVLKSPSGV
jgi:hypothetical protein